MDRPLVLVHTVEQWLSLSDSSKQFILKNITLRDRLEAWMKSRSKKPKVLAPTTHECGRCEGKGFVVKFPRMSGIHPSQVSTIDCDLKIYYDMLGLEEEKEIDFRLQITFDIGHAVHDMLQTYGKNGAWGPKYWSEVRISEDIQEIAHTLFLEGSADAVNILTIDVPGHPCVYEVGLVHEYKTINSSGFARLNGPKPAHKQQGTIYCAALDRPITVFAYINKDDSNIVEYPVSFDQNLWNGVYARAKFLNKLYNDETPPPGKFSKYACNDCGYKKICPEYKERTAT